MKCEYCQKEFTPKSLHQRFCSKHCQQQSSLENKGKVYRRICPVCEEVFETHIAHKRFCSQECATEYREIRADVLLRLRKTITELIDYARQHPEIPTVQLIKERYPK